MYRSNWNVQDCDQSLQTVAATCEDLQAATATYEIECSYAGSADCGNRRSIATTGEGRDAETFGSRRFPVAMAYVPWQCWGRIYELETALQRGTLFPELDKPFVGRRVCK